MKYYKLIEHRFAKEWPSLAIGTIYPEDFIANGRTIKEWLSPYNNAKDALLVVPKSEWLLQEAKLRYPIGTKFICHNTSQPAIICYGNFNVNCEVINETDNDGQKTITKGKFHCIYSDGIWAEIIKEEEKTMYLKKEHIKVGTVYRRIRHSLSHSPRTITHIVGDMFYYGPLNSSDWNNFRELEKYPNHFELISLPKEEKIIEREIKGYKLIKPEYEKAAYEICIKDENGWSDNPIYNFTVDSKAEKRAKEAGILDLWFEPVYEDGKFPIGTWVTYIGDYIDSYTTQVQGYDASGWLQSNINEPTEGHYKHTQYRLATPEETQASKFKVGDYVYIIDSAVHKELIGKVSKITKYDIKSNSGQLENGFDFSPNNPFLNEYIRLATPEEIEKAKGPDISINGYKAEFLDDLVKFGCAEIGKEVFINLNELNKLKLHKSNKEIEKVVIGKGTFTKEQIKEIAEYYESK